MLTLAALHGQDGQTAHEDARVRVLTFGARERQHRVVVLGRHHGRRGGDPTAELATDQPSRVIKGGTGLRA